MPEQADRENQYLGLCGPQISFLTVSSTLASNRDMCGRRARHSRLARAALLSILPSFLPLRTAFSCFFFFKENGIIKHSDENTEKGNLSKQSSFPLYWDEASLPHQGSGLTQKCWA